VCAEDAKIIDGLSATPDFLRFEHIVGTSRLPHPRGLTTKATASQYGQRARSHSWLLVGTLKVVRHKEPDVDVEKF
jgi:hypothetical protein